MNLYFQWVLSTVEPNTHLNVLFWNCYQVQVGLSSLHGLELCFWSSAVQCVKPFFNVIQLCLCCYWFFCDKLVLINL
jgi:hypothetical protein